MAEPKNTTNDYTVACVGVNYKKPGEAGPITLGLQGRVISLEADEAERLLGIGAVREATDNDLERELRARDLEDANRRASDPATGQPYGGTERVSKEQHAAQVYGDLKVEDLQAEVDRRGLTAAGTGAGGKVVRDDLVNTLVDNDQARGIAA